MKFCLFGGRIARTWTRNTLSAFPSSRCTGVLQTVSNRELSVVITEASWAADELKKLGVKLDPIPVAEQAEALSDNFLEEPGEKVVKLADSVLSLNTVEFVQLQRRIQVYSCLFHYFNRLSLRIILFVAPSWCQQGAY
jgi:hypothetical protein